MSETVPHIAVVFASLRPGGAERAMIHLANGFVREGIKTDVVVADKTGEFISHLGSAVTLIDLEKKQARKSIFAFRNYLKKFSPDVVIVAQTHMQIMVLAASLITSWKGKIILNEQSTFTSNIKNKLLVFLASILFKHAEALVCVSEGSAKNLAGRFPSLRNNISVIPNPVFSEQILTLKDENINHPFFEEKKYPVILSAGRLTASKNYSLLLKAFSLIIQEAEARLIILGEGENRKSLEREAKELGVSSFVSFPGNVKNTYAFMNRCDVFVLTSDYEGLPSVLIEALACGCKIVSTDCPNGPREILENGRYGVLVPVRDERRLANEILKKFSVAENAAEKLNRARDFSVEHVTKKYFDLIRKISAGE